MSFLFCCLFEAACFCCHPVLTSVFCASHRSHSTFTQLRPCIIYHPLHYSARCLRQILSQGSVPASALARATTGHTRVWRDIVAHWRNTSHLYPHLLEGVARPKRMDASGVVSAVGVRQTFGLIHAERLLIFTFTTAINLDWIIPELRCCLRTSWRRG